MVFEGVEYVIRLASGAGAGCIVTADNGISTGSSSSESSSPASFRSALRSLRSAWLILHAVNRRFILEHLECSRQPHIQGRGAQKRTQRAG